jgi:lipopolysaccharide transport system permease protein
VSSPSPVVASLAPGPRLRIDSRRRWFPDLGALLRYRRLIVLLSRRDITAKYRQTVLGTLWIFAGPLVSAGLFSLVFGRIAGLPSDGDSYFAFSYAALLGWNLFSTTLTSTSSSLTSNSALITKIYFPRLVLPLSTVGSTLLNTAVSFGVMLILLLIYDIGLSLQLLVLPVWLLLAIMLAVGIGAVLAALAVSYRDVNYMTPILTSLLVYVSPVAYSIEAVPDSLRTYYLLNPLTTIVEGCRWSLLGSGSLTTWAIAYTIALSIGALLVGLALFARLEANFADVI